MSTGWALVASVLLLAGNGFFVAAEFALVASKPHRLERLANQGSRSANAALRGSRELSLMLAGAQLGITICSLGLGALAEPAIADLIDPLLHATGLPEQVSYAVAFVISLAIVVFAHMVVGEMAPKSWAITHPERSALLLALPFRAYTATVRHILVGLNGISNLALRTVGVAPTNSLQQSQSPEELRLLLHQSREHGLLSTGQHRLLNRLLRVEQTTIGPLCQPRDAIVTVPADGDAASIEELTRTSGRSRLAVVDDAGAIIGTVHVRDAIMAAADAQEAIALPCARDLMSEPLVLSPTLSVDAAIRRMRAHKAHIALVGDGPTQGLVSLEDLLEQMLGAFYDETDARGQRKRS
ncbi:MAG: hemolysin family protein [Mycobacteriales bacterium]